PFCHLPRSCIRLEQSGTTSTRHHRSGPLSATRRRPASTPPHPRSRHRATRPASGTRLRIGGTTRPGQRVVLVVGMSRGVGAVLVAAAVMVSGCGADDGAVTTTSPPTEAPVNPSDLPLEERPDLFDPCAEIPIEAVEEALGGPVEPDEQLRIDRPGELLSCGWRNRDVIFTV